jgi:putative Mn2+ efflux pump MntP
MEGLLLAFGLAMDAFAVSVACGMCLPGIRLGTAIRASASFGFFQFAMPMLGWCVGSMLAGYVEGVDHWIAFALLAFIGARMLVEAIRERLEKAKGSCDEEEASKVDVRRFGVLMTLSVATSLDAMAVGVGWSFIGAPMLEAALLIGGVTFALCMLGFEFGKRVGPVFKEWAEVAGGLAIIGIGIKILVEHLSAG